MREAAGFPPVLIYRASMHPLIKQHQTALGNLCSRFHVRRLEVFGSAARGSDFDPDTSDIDFLVEYDPDYGAPAFGEYYQLKQALGNLMGRSVDLVMDGSVENPFVRAGIDRSRERVYGA
jgi:hypothetical protein